MQLKIQKGINDNYIVKGSFANDEKTILASLRNFIQLDWKKDKAFIFIDSDSNPIFSNDFLLTLINGPGKDAISHYSVINSSELTIPKSVNSSVKSWSNQQDFIQGLHANQYENSMILVLGIDEFLVNKVADLLSANITKMSMQVDLDALTHNLNYYKRCIAPSTKIMAMIKASGYGHGIVEVAHHLKNKVEYFGVAYLNEGIILRKQGITTPIMVMNSSANEFELYHMYHLDPEIYSLNLLLKLKEYLEEKQTSLNIHLEFDTGMNRLGFKENEIEQVIQLIKNSKYIHVKSMYSHMACAEDSTEDSFNKSQMKDFDKISAQLESELNIGAITHIRNSAGTLRYPDSPTNMVRLGIGLYGIDTNNLFQGKLKNVSVWKTVISQIRRVNEGETIGYNRSFKAVNNMVIATIAIGYADGFKRHFSNGKGSVLINGQLAPVVGNVNMDMTMVDVTTINTKEGDEVIIYNDELSVSTLAKNSNTIAYEIFTGIGERVKREYVFEF